MSRPVVTMKHDGLCEAAKDALTKVFSDRSVERSTTRESLKDLRDEIDIMLDALGNEKKAGLHE